ncbi:MAG: HEPN domain-containing protein [Deltaproteobacteria bacterium]|nr:HEPN domain-containing protein [Deltaproteobacteria bacterium]
MNRAELQALAGIRVAEAKVLLEAGHYHGAYYLIGYAVECALKACVAKQIREHDFPDRKLILESYTHDLGQLLAISGLKKQFDERVATDKPFEVNWSTVKDWNETSRYDSTINDIGARDLWAAVTDDTHGVLTWLKTLW